MFKLFKRKLPPLKIDELILNELDRFENSVGVKSSIIYVGREELSKILITKDSDGFFIFNTIKQTVFDDISVVTVNRMSYLRAGR